MGIFEIRMYAERGRVPFADWHGGLDPVTAARVDTCIRRLELGNFGAAVSPNSGLISAPATGFITGSTAILL